MGEKSVKSKSFLICIHAKALLKRLIFFYLAIALHYDTNGPRWLVATGFSRKFVIYDIKYLTQPMIMKDDCVKNIILSVDWCQLWETILYSYCDELPNSK